MAELLGDVLAGVVPRTESPSDQPLRYFPHDADAQFDPKCRRLLRRHGAAGYGRYWMLMEALASEPGHALGCSTSEQLEEIAVTLDLKDDREAEGFLCDLSSMGLVCVSSGSVSSRRMDENAEVAGRSREQRREAALKRWGR